MTNLYNRAGAAEECIEMLINHPEAHALLEAQIAYRRGEIDKVYGFARYFLSSRSGFYAILGGGILLALCAIWRGDIYLWNEAKRHIFQAPHDTPEEREIISLTQLMDTWMARLGDDCIFISARERMHIEELKELLYKRVKELHVQKYPYNDFLFQQYNDEGEAD